MYKHEYQGGPTVEILSCQGKDPLQKWKISGVGPDRLVYEKNVKGMIVQLEGSTVTSKIQLPKNSKQSLHLTQRYLIFQVFVPSSKDFSIELAMTDNSGCKRRLLMSTSARDISITPLHAKLNISIVKRNMWLNLCFDLASILSDLFAKQTFKSLELINIAGNCKVRKIFTMRNQPPDTTGTEFDTRDSVTQPYFQLENVPPSFQFSSTVLYVTQVIDVKKIRSEIERNCKKKAEASGSITSRSDKDIDSSRYSQDNHNIRESSKSSYFSQRLDKKTRRPNSSGTEKSNSVVSIDTSRINLVPKTGKINSNNHAPQSTSRPPFSLIQLVDDMEIRDSLENDSNLSENGSVFSFSSRPHLAQDRPRSSNSRGTNRMNSLDEDLSVPDEDNELERNEMFESRAIKESKSLPELVKSSVTSAPLRDSEITLKASAETLVQVSQRTDCEQSNDPKLNNYYVSQDDENTNSPHNVTVSRKAIRQISPKSDLSFEANDFTSLPVDTWTESFDRKLLSEMKKEQEEEELLAEEEELKPDRLHIDAVEDNDDSFNASWSTWKQPPGMDSEAYAGEMKGAMHHSHLQTLDFTLNHSEYDNSGNLPSPPIILPSERREKEDCYMSEAFGISDGSTVSGQSASVNESDDEEMLDLMYDPCLNCYFDPKSGRYYELKG